MYQGINMRQLDQQLPAFYNEKGVAEQAVEHAENRDVVGFHDISKKCHGCVSLTDGYYWCVCKLLLSKLPQCMAGAAATGCLRDDRLTAQPVMAYKKARKEYNLSIPRLWNKGVNPVHPEPFALSAIVMPTADNGGSSDTLFQ